MKDGWIALRDLIMDEVAVRLDELLHWLAVFLSHAHEAVGSGCGEESKSVLWNTRLGMMSGLFQVAHIVSSGTSYPCKPNVCPSSFTLKAQGLAESWFHGPYPSK